MPNWNVYKVFANGKRAKSPHTTFESDESSHFFESILPTLSPKLQKSKWTILNAAEPQERPAEQRDEVKEKFEKDKIRLLGSLAARKFPQFAKKKVEACLMMNQNTDWKWAWCVAESATHRYLGEISQRFDYSKQADEWVKEQVVCMAGTAPIK